jgi:Ycf66 protein N-terminus
LVNASLNWASIVGIVLAVGGAFLYFMRNFKPALARDYDVFFAAVGLLCGGILFFQGWRLDPILQFGQFLLAGSTVFFAYESVRLRGVTTEQARRSSYFDEEEPAPFRPRGGLGGGGDFDRDRFDQPEPIRRRIRSRDEEEDFYRPRPASRAAIPERAASRRGETQDWDNPTRDDGPRPGFRPSAVSDGSWGNEPSGSSRYGAGSSGPSAAPFGARRRERDSGPEPRRGSRPTPSNEPPLRSNRRPGPPESAAEGRGSFASDSRPLGASGVPQGTPIRGQAAAAPGVSDADFSPVQGQQSRRPGSDAAAPPSSRDNSSRFDD